MNTNMIGLTETAPAPVADGPFRIYTTADYDSMVNGEEFAVNLNWDPRQLNDALMPLVQRKVRISDPIMLHLFLPGGIPFLKGKLNDFFSMPEFGGARHAIYVVITKRINDSVLKKEYLELCDCRSDDSKLLLSPLYKQSENGYSHIACLLGYLRRSGLKTDLFIRAMCKYTGFAPLIVSIFRMSEGLTVYGRDIVCVTASLFCFYRLLIPIDNERLFDYLLRCSCFVVHGVTKQEETADLPLLKVENNPSSRGAVERYCQSTNQDSTVIIWEGDMGKTFARSVMQKPKEPAAIEQAFNTMVSFKPVAPLTLRTVTGATICQGTKGNTLLFISQSQAKDSKAANNVEVMDPLTGKSTVWDVEDMAKRIGDSSGGGSAVLIDNDKVKQVIFVCFDESSSMTANMDGCRCRKGEAARVTIATQYLTSFANKTYGFRVPCIQGLISFNNEITPRCPLSPLVPDFEDGIKKVVPQGTTRLWDALNKAADDLVAFAFDDKKKKFPNAKLRILVISDGDDVGSSANPWQVCEKLCKSNVVVDSVIVSSEDSCKMLGALCHMTGGMSCRPSSIEEGLLLFEQEAFLCIDTRMTNRKSNLAFDEATMKALAEELEFDKAAPSKVISVATSKKPLATAKNMICKNRQTVISDARRRRILRELHYAASVMEPDAKGVNEKTGEPMSIYDPELRVYPFCGNLDQWKVFIKGTEGTPYANKWWYIYVTFPETYPMLPPVFRFVSVPYHLNVSSEGRVCLSMLEKGYMANAVVVELIQRIRELFLLPDESTPIQISKLEQFKSDRAAYDRLARASADQYGKNTVEEWLQGLTIESDVDPNFTVAVGQSVVPDYLKSGITGKYIPKDKRVMASSGVIYNRDELITLIMSSNHPVCAVTGKPLTETVESLYI